MGVFQVHAYSLRTNYMHALKHKPFMYVKNKFLEVLGGKQGIKASIKGVRPYKNFII